MRKIVFLQKSNIYSGAESIVLMIMKFLPKNEYYSVYVSPDGEIRDFVELEGLDFYPMKDSSMKSIKRAIFDIRPDLIHATDYGMSSYASRLHMQIPIVAHLHNNAPWLKCLVHPKNIAFTLSLSNIASVISVSNSIENEFIHATLLSKKNHVIYNVVDLLRVKEYASKEEDNVCNNVDIAFLGRLTISKNLFLFCEIVQDYKIKNKNVRALIIGDGELEQELKEYIVNHNLQDNIEMVGFQKNPYKYLKKAKLLLMPSKYEGFGLAAVESLALGKPVVCSGAGGLRDIVTPECGAICSTKEEYLQEINQLLENKEYYNFKAQNATIIAQKFGDISTYIEKIISVYNECMQGKE